MRSVCCEITDGCHRYAFAVERSWQTASEVDAGDDILVFRVDLANGSAQPAVWCDIDRFGGVPDVHGPEVRTVGFRITDAVDDGDIPLVPEVFNRSHARVQAEFAVEVEDFVLLETDRLSGVLINAIGVRHHGV